MDLELVKLDNPIIVKIHGVLDELKPTMPDDWWHRV